MFKVDEQSEHTIMSNPTQAQLMYMAKKNGMVTMKQDGFLKVISGITTIEEVESATG